MPSELCQYLSTNLFRVFTSLFFTEQDAVSLPQRPFLHCSTLPLLLLLLLLVWRVVTGNLLRLGLLLFSSLFSHHLRDATRRGLWFIGNVFFSSGKTECFLGWFECQHMYIKSTTVYVPSLELELSHPLSLQRVCPSPTPFPQETVPLPPEPKGGGHTRLRVRGWGSPNSDDWRKS
jgi:hypothetical protein